MNPVAVNSPLSSNTPPSFRGRGAATNPPNRFEEIHFERDIDWDPSEDVAPGTRFYKDQSCSILSYNDSPDVGFTVGVNCYRGCEHGCIYCYARPTHEYLGMSSGLDFETRIMVKERGPELLRKELASPKWKPQTVAMSGVTDCYQPAERKFKLTRGCLEVFLEFRNPTCIVTKNHLVTRDIDLLSQLASFNAAAVFVSVTTLDHTMTQRLEPRTSLPKMRLAAIRALSEAGIPVGVLMAPVIPGLTDHEMPNLLLACAEAGAKFAGYVPLRLPYAVKNLFEDWLERHFPERKDKVLNRIRSMRGGKLNDPSFGTRMRGEGIFADQLEALFSVASRKAGFAEERLELSTASFRVAASESRYMQKTLPLFEKGPAG